MIADSAGRSGSRKLGFFSVDDARVSRSSLNSLMFAPMMRGVIAPRSVGAKKVNYIRMVWMLERYLTENEFKRFIKNLTDLLMRYVETYAIKHVLNQIGFVELLQKTAVGSLLK